MGKKVTKKKVVPAKKAAVKKKASTKKVVTVNLQTTTKTAGGRIVRAHKRPVKVKVNVVKPDTRPKLPAGEFTKPVVLKGETGATRKFWLVVRNKEAFQSFIDIATTSSEKVCLNKDALAKTDAYLGDAYMSVRLYVPPAIALLIDRTKITKPSILYLSNNVYKSTVGNTVGSSVHLGSDGVGESGKFSIACKDEEKGVGKLHVK